MARHRDQQGFECPHCGAFVAARMKACRACGASDESGWNDDDLHDPDYGEDDFDYDEFTAREFPQHAAHPGTSWTRRSLLVAWIVVAVIVSILWSLMW